MVSLPICASAFAPNIKLWNTFLFDVRILGKHKQRIKSNENASLRENELKQAQLNTVNSMDKDACHVQVNVCGKNSRYDVRMRLCLYLCMKEMERGKSAKWMGRKGRKSVEGNGRSI